MSTKPRPDDFPSWWTYHQAKRVWLRGHGGSVWVTLLIALFFGGLTGSTVLLVSLVLFALVGTWYARSQP